MSKLRRRPELRLHPSRPERWVLDAGVDRAACAKAEAPCGSIAPESRRAAVFDLDRTLIRIPAVVAVAPTLYRAHLLGRAALWRAMRIGPACVRRPRDHADIDRVREVLLSIVRGWDPVEVRGAIEAAAPRLVARIAYRHARAIIDGHRALGDLVVVASSSPSDVVIPIAQELGADVVIATTARLRRDGRYAGELEFLCHGQAKADAVRALCSRLGIDLLASTGYSDALADLPLLTAVGCPVATNPERRLAAIARDAGWTILGLGARAAWPVCRRSPPRCVAARVAGR